jgi:hypothetical protein
MDFLTAKLLKNFAENSEITVEPRIDKGKMSLSIFKAGKMLDTVELKFGVQTPISELIKNK